MENKWERINCTYFSTTARRVFSDFFEGLGFKILVTKIGGLLFRQAGIYVEISYDQQTYPKYAPVLIIGLGEDKYDDVGEPTGVPMWSLLPSDDESLRYSSWRFSTDTDLEQILIRIKELIVVPHMKPLFQDRRLLKYKIECFKRTINEQA